MIEAFRTLPLAAISDALDVLGIAGHCPGVKPLVRDFRIVARCFTLEYGPIEETPGGTVGDYVENVPEGYAILIANHGRMDCSVWGDLLTLAAGRRGLAGTVIDGVCRDSDSATKLGYPLFAKGTFMRTGKGRIALTAVQKPVFFAGVKVSPGDIVVGGADGVLVVPSRAEEEVAALAREIEDKENKIRAIVREGGSLKQARAKFRYHAIGPKS